MNHILNDFDRVLNDLAVSIQTDISPIIQPNKSEGGYFGVPRMVFCYVDFLGLLYCGWIKKYKNEQKQNFATSRKAIKFIREILGRIDRLYKTNGGLLYDMYRHGTIHIYSPKKLKSKKFPDRTIEWLLYKGDRERWDYYENRATKFHHLKIINWANNRFLLPVSINVLYADLIESMVLYRSIVHNDKSGKLLKNFRTVAEALNNDFDSTPYKFW